MPSRWTIPDRI